MMIVFKKLIVVIFIVIVVVTSCLLLRCSRQRSFEEMITSLKDVDQIEHYLGHPIYQNEQDFGSVVLSKQEIEDGLSVSVYVVQKTPLRFLIAKVDKKGRIFGQMLVEPS